VTRHLIEGDHPMLTEPLIQQLTALRLGGMAAALEQQLASPDLER